MLQDKDAAKSKRVMQATYIPHISGRINS
jgi:hypothetical protein